MQNRTARLMMHARKRLWMLRHPGNHKSTCAANSRPSPCCLPSYHWRTARSSSSACGLKTTPNMTLLEKLGANPSPGDRRVGIRDVLRPSPVEFGAVGVRQLERYATFGVGETVP